MRVTQIEVLVHTRTPNPDPIRDALQSLPGAGAVETIVHTDDGLTGRGDASFGRIAGGPAALASVIEQILAPIVIGRDPIQVRAIHEELLRFGIAHDWAVYDGDHVNHIAERFDEVVLPFFAKHLDTGGE